GETAEVVCLDAHLDMYARAPAPAWLPAHDGARLALDGPIRSRDAAAGLPQLPTLHPDVALRARALAWEQAWLLLLLDRMPRLTRVTWVVPDHFARGLAAGFPYPQAAWHALLEDGAAAGIW